MFRLAMPVVGLLIALAVPAVASAGQPVDPSTLTPEPPPGAECRATGNGVICDTVFDASIPTPLPVAELPCGTLHETNSDLRDGVRWHDAEGRLLERQVTQQLRGTWSLSARHVGPDGLDLSPRELARSSRSAGRFRIGGHDVPRRPFQGLRPRSRHDLHRGRTRVAGRLARRPFRRVRRCHDRGAVRRPDGLSGLDPLNQSGRLLPARLLSVRGFRLGAGLVDGRRELGRRCGGLLDELGHGTCLVRVCRRLGQQVL